MTSPTVEQAIRALVDAIRAALAAERDQGPPRLLTVAEAATTLRISRESLYQLMRRGELGSVLDDATDRLLALLVEPTI